MSGVPGSAGTWAGDRLAHEAFVFSDDEQVRARCLPFVREALDRDEQVVVVASSRVRTLLRAEFGHSVEDFAVFAAAEAAWRGGAQTLADYQATMQPLLAAGRPWRLVGEPVWLAGPGGGEWSRFEAVANQAFAGYPYYSLCLHDTRRVGAPAIDAQLATHPTVWDGAGPVANPRYRTTADFLRTVEPAWDVAPTSVPALQVTARRRALDQLEAWVEGHGDPRRQDEVLLAVYELVSNALKAAGAAEVRCWVDGIHDVWEVSDEGPGMHDVAAGYAPPRDDLECGRGLWMARCLADEATVRSAGPGTAVRLYFARRSDSVHR